jgi:hypothetical protein
MGLSSSCISVRAALPGPTKQHNLGFRRHRVYAQEYSHMKERRAAAPLRMALPTAETVSTAVAVVTVESDMQAPTDVTKVCATKLVEPEVFSSTIFSSHQNFPNCCSLKEIDLQNTWHENPDTVVGSEVNEIHCAAKCACYYLVALI